MPRKRKPKTDYLDATHLEGCQRCGGNHEMLRFAPLNNPVDEYAWWALCPTTKQPLLMRTTKSEQETDNAA